MSLERVIYEVRGAVAAIVLNRPEKRNALDPQTILETTASVLHADSEAAVRVITIAGAGKDFCSGADLASVAAIAERGVTDNIDDARALAQLFLAIRRASKPVVALVKGRALAGGCGLATACDIVLASETAKFGYPEVNIGFVPAMVMAILRRESTNPNTIAGLQWWKTAFPGHPYGRESKGTLETVPTLTAVCSKSVMPAAT